MCLLQNLMHQMLETIEVKGGFFSEGEIRFQISQSPKKLFQKTILSLKFEIPAHIISQILNSFKYCDLSFWKFL